MTVTTVAAVDIAALLRGVDGVERAPITIDTAPPPSCPGHTRRGDYCAAPGCASVPERPPLDRYAAAAPVRTVSLIDAAGEIGVWAGFTGPWAGDSPAVILGVIAEEIIRASTDPGRYGIEMPEPELRANFVALAIVTAIEMAGLTVAKTERLKAAA